jgi:uncharacterized membrane protein YfcA
MFEVGLELVLFFGLVGFIAGFIDAIAGGGGLLTLPSLILSGLDPISALATNKLQSTFGSGTASLTFFRHGYLNGRKVILFMLLSGGGASLGTLAVSALPTQDLGKALPFLIMGVAIYFILSPKLSNEHGTALMPEWLFLGLCVPFIGFYDGIFGPGTGSFFMVAFTLLRGQGAIHATAQSKVCNLASNFASLMTFAFSGKIILAAGIPMGLGQVAGAWLGARASIRVGVALIRPLVVLVSLTLSARLAIEAFPSLRGLIFGP